MITVFLLKLTISTFWKYWSIYMILLGIIFIVGSLIENSNGQFHNKIQYKFKKNQTINVPKSKFVNIVIDWCKKNLEHPKYHKYYPMVEVKYYKYKKASGDYSSSNKIIRIFVNNHQTIEDLVNTCIHEYVHYLQMPYQANQEEYNRFNKTNGYLNNPYEVEARERAELYTPQCIKHLIKMGYIS